MNWKNFREKISQRYLITFFLFFLSSNIDAQEEFRLNGYALANDSKECLIGATISSEDVWTTTNEFGFFSLKLAKGEHKVKCSYVGRRVEEIELEIEKDTMIVLEMLPIERLENAVVIAESGLGQIQSIKGALEIPTRLIGEIPTVFGEPDLFKTIQKMPGVQSGIEGFSGIYIRGGGSDENLILLDGAPIYNSSHLMGLLSTFTPEAIKQVKLYKNFFPAKYGGRTSSIIDVRTKEGNAYSFHGIVSAGLIDDRVYIEGPIVKENTSFSVSARGMNTILLSPLTRILDIPYFCSFYDLTGKITHRFKNSDRLYLSIYQGHDKFNYSKSSSSEFSYVNDFNIKKNGKNVSNEEYNLQWGNTTADIRWTHNFLDKFFSDLSISWSRYGMAEETFQEDMNYAEQQSGYSIKNKNGSGISDIQLLWDFEMKQSSRHSLNFGLSHIIHSFSPQKSISQRLVNNGEKQDKNISYNNESDISFLGSESSLYCEDDLKIGESFDASIGLRGTMFYTLGKYYWSIEPRIAFEYKLSNSFSVKSSYTRMSQYVHLLASGNMSLPTDLWVPITQNIDPVVSNQYSIGIDYFTSNSWRFAIDAYYKTEDNVLEYKDSQLAFTSSVDWEQSVEMGKGESKGIELLIQKKVDNLTGGLAYTLSKTDRVFPNGTINYGEPFPFTYDRRHDVDMYLNYKLNDKVSINGSWTFASGNMVTASWRSIAILGPDGDVSLEPYISGRNNFRLPPSHRLDVSVNFRKEKKNGLRIWTVGLYNAYCSMNPNWVVNDSNVEYGDNGSIEGLYHYLSKRTLLPILPSFSYSFAF